MFFYHPRMTTYDFGPAHPLRPERLRRSIALLESVCPDLEILDPGVASADDALRVHGSDYVEFVREMGAGATPDAEVQFQYGFTHADTPPFADMYNSSLAYMAGSVRAAEAVRDGAPLAMTFGGGLHHARRDGASGFCVFNDCAIACSILREAFDRVAYVDIDLHHGDGVQWIFYDDPNVLTYSIHETGRSLYPGTGFVQESGAEFTKINLPLEPGTTGDTWAECFRQTLPDALERFRPGAIVLQMGADPHVLDPLGHLQVTVQEWLSAVQLVRDFGLPLVAVGGGGYNLTVVPRAWVAAILTLLRRDVPESIPYEIPMDWKMETFFDLTLPEPRWANREVAYETVQDLRGQVLQRMPRR